MVSTLETDVKLDASEPRRVVEMLGRFASDRGMSPKLVQRFELALDEVLTNVVSYAFSGDEPEPAIQVKMELTGEWLTVCVQDNGPAFDPLNDSQDPDFSLSAEDRPIGGLGIFLAKTFVHSLTYNRVDGFNRLTLAQPLEAPPEDTNP